MQIIMALFAGITFGVGIMISGMASPAKVLNFFDIAGFWDPSLMFVMGGALLTTLIGYRVILTRDRPLLADQFHLPDRNDIDVRLIAGAAIFGIGWGIAGFCPGGAIPAVGTGRSEVLIFVAGLVAGLLATRLALKALTVRRPSKGAPSTV